MAQLSDSMSFSVETSRDSSFEMSSHSSFEIPSYSSFHGPIPDFIYCVFDPTYDPSHPCSNIWKNFSEHDHGFDSQMLLSKFMMTRDDLPESKFVTAVLVPAEDLRHPFFQYSHEYEECSDLVTLGHIMNQGGVCLVFEDCRDAFSKCVAATPTALELIRNTMLRNEFNGSYSEIVCRMKNPTNFSQFMLDEHSIFSSSKELPTFVQAKKQQMERRRDWSHWDLDQDALKDYTKSCFATASKGLDYTDFVDLQPPSPGAVAPGHDFYSGYSPSLLKVFHESGFLSTVSTGGPDREHSEDSIQRIFSYLFKCIEVSYKSPDCPALELAMPLPTTHWPNNMGVLTFPKKRWPGVSDCLRFIRPRSDVSLFWGCEIVFLAAIESRNTDFRRMMALAAFWVRLVNRTLQTNECCLPIFWVSDQAGMSNHWAGECYLVYEYNTHIYYHRLEYTPPESDCQLPNFPLTDAHSRAHFHLRLLNAADPCHRQLNASQQTMMKELWRKFRCIAIVQDEKRNDGHIMTRKQKRDRSIDLPEFRSSFELEKTGRHGIYFIRLKTGQRCIRKMIGKSGGPELNVYERLEEHRNSSISGINHFILEWSTGSWSLGKYLQLPRLISVSHEMVDAKSSCFDKQVLSLCKQLLVGINFLHSQLEVAHMDIKPDNLVLDLRHYNSLMFTLKIIDFSLSIMDANRMVAGFRGTKGYIAPEVEECSQYWPFLADRYSCGVCMEVFLAHGQEVLSCHPFYSAFVGFAIKLRRQSPSERPPLMDLEELHWLDMYEHQS